MRSRALAGLLTATLLSAGCTAGNSETEAAPRKTCPYDSPRSLLTALKAGLGDETSVHVDMKMSGGGQRIGMSGDIAMTATDTSMDMRYTGDDEFAVVVVDRRVFLSTSADDPKYVEVPGTDPTIAKLIEGANLRRTFDAFEVGLEAVEALGREDVRGESVCHYELTVDVTKAARASGNATPPGTPPTINYELYLGDDNLMRRITFTFGPISTVMNASGWNEPREIKVPTTG